MLVILDRSAFCSFYARGLLAFCFRLLWLLCLQTSRSRGLQLDRAEVASATLHKDTLIHFAHMSETHVCDCRFGAAVGEAKRGEWRRRGPRLTVGLGESGGIRVGLPSRVTCRASRVSRV